MPATSNHVDHCTLCLGATKTIVELKPTPPANEILPIHNEDKELFPLNLVQCQHCQHLQLDTEISMFRLFKHYVYTSNTSASNYRYFHYYATQMMSQFTPKFVVDIGSNDGMFLHFFQEQGCKVLGVDPAENICDIANNNGITTQCNFFNEMTALDIKNRNGEADLITCNNMFAHNKSLDEVLLGVQQLLSKDGTFVFEVSYAMDLLKNNLFDLIYHEHFHHWHLAPAIAYLKKFNLQIYDAELIGTHGGSVRVYAKRWSKDLSKTSRLAALLYQEELYFEDYLKQFVKTVPAIRDLTVKLLNDLWYQGKQISILGYPAKACTLTYYFDLNPSIINKVYDDNPLKIGKYSHQGQLIEPATNIVKDKPDYLFLLSWNYKDEMLKKYKWFTKGGGHLIVPLPKLEII
jgi:2-polyprenyl-3-methyl-5-hydroxy-6-metoxy-1,4-benzoquinol methylase